VDEAAIRYRKVTLSFPNVRRSAVLDMSRNTRALHCQAAGGSGFFSFFTFVKLVIHHPTKCVCLPVPMACCLVHLWSPPAGC
jgi:hypothetical protein